MAFNTNNTVFKDTLKHSSVDCIVKTQTFLKYASANCVIFLKPKLCKCFSFFCIKHFKTCQMFVIPFINNYSMKQKVNTSGSIQVAVQVKYCSGNLHLSSLIHQTMFQVVCQIFGHSYDTYKKNLVLKCLRSG